jgi:hypothetical protein
MKASPKAWCGERDGSPRTAYASEQDRRLRGTHNTVTVSRKARDEYLLDYVKREPSDRGDESPMGCHIGSKALPLLSQFIDGFL